MINKKRFLATEAFEVSLYNHQLMDGIEVEPEETIAILYDHIRPCEETYSFVKECNIKSLQGFEITNLALVLENNRISKVPDYVVLNIFSGSGWLDKKRFKLGLLGQFLIYYYVVK